jgi:hypothetical protein
MSPTIRRLRLALALLVAVFVIGSIGYASVAVAP